jgi:hypothetical protein
MPYAPTADDPSSLAIPVPPRRGRRRVAAAGIASGRGDGWREAVREASLAGFLTLAASWALAEVAFLFLG